jgi:CheY-like chemotaxis protein
MANAFRVGIMGLLSKEARLVELVLRHTNLRDTRFKVCKTPAQLKDCRIVIGRPLQAGGSLVMPDSLTTCQYIEVVDRAENAKNDLFVEASSLVTSLMPVLKRALSRLMRQQVEPDTQFIPLGAPKSPEVATAVPSASMHAGTRAPLAAQATAPRLEPAQVRVLIVDDSPTVRQQLTGGLQNMGMHCTSAAHAQSALDMLTNEHFDLVIADVVMPEMDGYEFTRKVRRAYPSIPVIILTSKTSPFDKARGALAGCTTFLSKPVSRADLERSMLKALKQRDALTA